jgi:hypothetical protein
MFLFLGGQCGKSLLQLNLVDRITCVFIERLAMLLKPYGKIEDRLD